MIRLDNWLEKTGFIKILHQMGVESSAYVLLGKWSFWITFWILLEVMANVREGSSINGKFNQLIVFIPMIIGAVIIILIGLFIARFVKKTLSAIRVRAGSKASGILANISFYAMMIITVVITLNQIGVNTSILAVYVSILLGALLLSSSLAFVYASKDILTNILASSYNKNNYYVGQ
jgi:small-conductance mechanosensitive channel